MSGIMIQIDLTRSDTKSSTESPGSKKHKRFLKRRRFLERKGLLRDKQCLFKNQGPAPRRNGAKPEHRPLPGASSSHRQSAEPATPSSSSSLTITVKNTGANGKAEQAKKITATNAGQSKKITITEQSKKITITEQSEKTGSAEQSRRSMPFGNPLKSVPYGNPLKYLAIDCEMVGTGPKGRVSELARCSIVSYDGDVVYDKYIKPANPVTDLRTRWSGITWANLSRATPFADARKEILKLLSGKVVIGHAVHNDFRALGYGHPANLTRDTSRSPLLNHKAGFGEKECASLKRLTKALFNRDIQTGKRGHSSVEDAKATMELYKAVEAEWERTIASSP